MPPPVQDTSRGAAKAEPDPLITLKVLDQDGRRAYHTMRMADQLQALMDAYYRRAPGVTYGTGTFLFDGSIRLQGRNTPAELDMNDGDEIDFFEKQVGGAREDI